MELTKTIYKYMEYKHARDLVCSGSFRIGTLYDYKKTESHGYEIGDEIEGQKIIRCEQNLIIKDFNQPQNFDKYFPQFAGVETIDNITLTNDLSSPNIFVCSFSNSFDITTMKRMGYDSCVKILDLNKFLTYYFKKIIKKGLATGRYATCKELLYTDNKEMDISDAHDRPAWEMKEMRYQYQDEYRAVFEATNPKKIEPIILKSYGAKKYCSIIHKP